VCSDLKSDQRDAKHRRADFSPVHLFLSAAASTARCFLQITWQPDVRQCCNNRESRAAGDKSAAGCREENNWRASGRKKMIRLGGWKER
jgi:hypothetical protein